MGDLLKGGWDLDDQYLVLQNRKLNSPDKFCPSKDQNSSYFLLNAHPNFRIDDLKSISIINNEIKFNMKKNAVKLQPKGKVKIKNMVVKKQDKLKFSRKKFEVFDIMPQLSDSDNVLKKYPV